jgi:hypothetical protein
MQGAQAIMPGSNLVNLAGLLDDAKCVALVRQHRWPEAVRCPGCGRDGLSAKQPTYRQNRLRLDASLELLVQPLDRIGCPRRFPLALRQAREGERILGRSPQAQPTKGDGHKQ